MEEQLKVIISAEIDKLKSELQKGKKEVEDFGKKSKVSFKDFNDGIQAAGNVAKGAMAAAGAAVIGVSAALLSLDEATAEYRRNQALLATAFETAGGSAGTAKKVYNDLYRVLGDDGQATEAAQHLAQLTTNQEELSEITTAMQGVYATFGASLPLEGLAEAMNHTAKLGEVQGSFADALEWSGISVDAYNEQLAACNTEAEREALIRSTLTELYGTAAANYETNNAALLAQNEAQARLNENMAKIGEVMTPINTLFKEFAATVLEKLTPYIQDFAENHLPTLQAILEKVAEAIGAVISWIVDNWELVSTIATVIGVVVAALTALSTIMGIVNAVMAASPITWIIAGIVALIAVIALCVIYWDEIKAAGAAAWEAIKNAWANVKAWFAEKFAAVKQAVSDAFSNIGNFGRNAYNTIKNAFSTVGSWFKNIFTNAASGVKSAFSTITGFFRGIWNSIKSIFSDVGTAIATGIKGAVSTAVNKVLSVATGIINGFIRAINAAISVINAIPGVSIGYLNELSVPAMARGGVVDGATLAMIGERGAEMVMPLENNLEYLDKLAAMLNERMGGGNRHIVLNVDGKTFAEIACDSINDLTRQRGNIPLVIA